MSKKEFIFKRPGFYKVNFPSIFLSVFIFCFWLVPTQLYFIYFEFSKHNSRLKNVTILNPSSLISILIGFFSCSRGSSESLLANLMDTQLKQDRLHTQGINHACLHSWPLNEKHPNNIYNYGITTLKVNVYNLGYCNVIMKCFR